MRIQDEIVAGSAFCNSYVAIEGTRARKRCPGYEMRPAKILKTTKITFYGDVDPEADSYGGRSSDTAYASHEYLNFVDARDRVCPFCEQETCTPTLLTEHVQYDNVSLQDPDTLLGLEERRHQEAIAANATQGDMAAALGELGRGLQEMVLSQREEVALLRARLEADIAERRRWDEEHDAEEPEPAPASRKG